MRTLESWDICVWIRVLGNIQTWKVKKKRKLKSPKKRVENFCFDPPLLFMVDPTLSLFFTHSLIHISLFYLSIHFIAIEGRKEGDEFLIFLFSNTWLIKPLLFFFLFNIPFSSFSSQFLRTILYQDPPLLKLFLKVMTFLVFLVNFPSFFSFSFFVSLQIQKSVA